MNQRAQMSGRWALWIVYEPSRTAPPSPGAAPATAPTGHPPAPHRPRERRHGHPPAPTGHPLAPLRPRDRQHGHPPAPLRPRGRRHGHAPAPHGRTAITNTAGARTCNKKQTRTKECEERHCARRRTNPSGGLTRGSSAVALRARQCWARSLLVRTRRLGGTYEGGPFASPAANA